MTFGPDDISHAVDIINHGLDTKTFDCDDSRIDSIQKCIEIMEEINNVNLMFKMKVNLFEKFITELSEESYKMQKKTDSA
jgi:hypothetical protein